MTQPTQTQHPWRATIRTVAAVALALLPVLPQIAAEFGVGAVPVVASVLAVAGAVTRVLAIPAVNTVLRDHMSWLAAEPKEK